MLTPLRVFMICFGLLGSAAFAEPLLQTAGTAVLVSGYGEVKHPNDEARAVLMIEEQDKDKAAAASRVNQKMRQGTELVKRADPDAVLQTYGYYSYPVYADQPAQARPGVRQPVGWRVGQYLGVRTTNLTELPKTVAAAQQVLALNSLQFGLADATRRKLQEQQYARSYGDLLERVKAIAQAMGRNPAEASLETLDFDGSGGREPQPEMMMKTMRAAPAAQVEEPSFEPGETALSMRVAAKLRFK
jgi:uncharacterized protein YggE